ncbi:SET domain-containing protein [Pseudomonas fluorescens]|uniref:SET domain-containing protein-lysine N-methyltransferase n=1 Tax=Pseudomonas fluorescens TaxID=294 RepID=UPI00177E6FEA|nr:SET domain-containing protein-lysine N-methyltransferase [Pseudomonas fluorescens]MBD8099644.1 SET domain-containing protein [Pseudomonas fluorescens]MBD8776635.1 SET domain-containing protein [Pseudomonas fluorescens]MBD8781079.1 SET domain-containing protein [Pseudomonas fluorescens]MBD8798324.1 SET domain-containing protein [Pseudomonas fluorescens]
MKPTLSRLMSKSPPTRLSDLDHLLDHLAGLIQGPTLANALTSYYYPPADSALGRECKAAFRVLKILEEDDDFKTFLSEKPSPNNSPLGDFPYDFLSELLSTPKSPIPTPAEVFDIAGHPVVLRKAPLYFANQIDVLLDIHRKVGNGVKSDGSVRLDRVLAYYAIIPAAPTTMAQWKAVQYHLQEYRALCRLGHDGHVSDLEHLLGPEDDKIIKHVVRDLERDNARSLFAQVVPQRLTPAQQAALDTTPTVLLEQLLNTRENLAVGQSIAAALDWYGAGDDQECPQAVKVKLLWRALWLTITPDAHSLNDNELKAFIPPAVNYGVIRQSLIKEYERSLDLNPSTARLAVCVLKANIPSEIWVEGIPDELPYGTSSAWVNFKSGFILAESVAPGSSRHMTFERLLNLPGEFLRVYADEPAQQTLVVAAKIQPTLTWAVETGLLPVSRYGYSTQDIEHALAALEQHESEMIKAAQDLALQPPSRFRFNSDAEFDQAFNDYLHIPRAAYKTLIKGLLAQFAPLWPGNSDRDEITVYSLRKPLHDVQVEHEDKHNTDAVRGRSGFILRLACADPPYTLRYIEVFPNAGIVRVREDLKNLWVGGEVKVERVGGTSRSSRGRFRKGTELPFDWKAYQDAVKPEPGQTATLIVEQVGQVMPALIAPHDQQAPQVPPPLPPRQPLSLAANIRQSPRIEALAEMIARELFFCDEKILLEKTRKATRAMDIGRDFFEDISYWGKMFVPFWGAIDDLASGDPQRIESGGLGLFTDIVSFGVPIGKYIAGCTRVVVQAGKAGIRLALPHLSTLTRKLITATLQELNPLGAVVAVLNLGRFALINLGTAALRQASKGIAQLRDGSVAARHMISVDPRIWSPRQAGDRLFTVDGCPNIPMRNVGTLEAADYRLIDAGSNRVFGPRFREPVTVISNSNPLIRKYAVDPRWIAGLKPDSRGIFFRAEYNQRFICNIDDKGTISVYQVRDNSYGFIQETAAGADNSFSVVLVNPKSNRDLSITLSSVEPGHWYSSLIKVTGGAPEKPDFVTPSVLLNWTQASENALKKTMDDFVRTYNLDPNAFRQFVHTGDNLASRGLTMLDRAGTARTEVTFDHLESWRTTSQKKRNTLTLEGFAADHNLDPRAFAEYVNLDGSYRAAGKVLAKHASGAQFTPVSHTHLQAWYTLYNANNSSSSMATFVEANDLNPVIWSTYVNDNGSLTRVGREMRVFGSRDIVDEPIARKRPTAPPQPGSSKRPRLEDDTPPSRHRSTSITGSYDHRINNNAPILQDPNDVRRSLTQDLEGPPEKIKITEANQFFDEFNGRQHIEIKKAATKSIREWIAREGNHHRTLDRLLEVKKLDEGSERGLSVVAKSDIKRFDVLGPYTGKLHLNKASIAAEVMEKGRVAVGTYLFQTNTKGASISGHGNSNILSLINAVNVPRIADVGIENVAALHVGKYMVFLLAWKDIPAGTELLMDYGREYWKYIKPQGHRP